MKNNIPFPTPVLFDFDGVVVDSFQSHYSAWGNAFKELFATEISPFPHNELAGKSPYLIAEYFCKTVGHPEKTLEYYQLKGEHLHAGLVPPKLLPGVIEIQTFLTEQSIPHGIASNATRLFIKNSISQLGLGFTSYFGIEDYQNPKPHPEAYITLAKHLNIPKEQFLNTWVFEDSLPGIQAAKEAGMFAVGIATLHNDATLMEAGSQLVFPTLLEAFEYLKLQLPDTRS